MVNANLCTHIFEIGPTYPRQQRGLASARVRALLFVDLLPGCLFVHTEAKFWLLSQRYGNMSAGLSQDLGDRLRDFWSTSTRPPIVEIDTEATATYVRFGRG